MIKFLKEFLSVLTEVKIYIEDLIKFITSQKEYFEKIEIESDYDTVKRVAIYAIVFAFIEYILFSGVEEFNYIKILKISFLETAVSLSPFPIIYLQFYLLKSNKKIKSAIVYCLSFRFTYIIIPLIFYFLLLNTEIYYFFIISSFFVYVYILYLIFQLPIVFPLKYKRRILVFVTTIIAFLIYFIPIALLIMLFSPNKEKALQLSPLFDPIRYEVQNEIMEGYDWTLDIKFDKFIKNTRKQFFDYSVEKNDNNIILFEGDFLNYITEIKNESKSLKNEYVVRRKKVEESFAELDFNLTKDFIKLKISDIDSRLNYLDNINSEDFSITDINLSIANYDKCEKKFIEKLADYIEKTNILKRYLLLIF